MNTPQPQNAFDFADSPASDRQSGSILEWLARSYETMDDWKTKARRVFLSSNGDSSLSRNRVASMVRRHFLETPPKAEDVLCWKAGFEDTATVHVTPPKVSESNSAYVDWLYVADYLLLSCALPTDELEEENQRRETEFQSVLGSYNRRLTVHDAREEMRSHRDSSDEDILASVEKNHPTRRWRTSRKARRLEKANAYHAVPKEPTPADPIPRYTPLYF